MTLGPAEVSRLLLSAAESGGSGAVVVVVGEVGESGRRMALTRSPDGEETVHGSLGGGLDEAALDRLLNAAGLMRMSDVGSDDLKRAYFNGANWQRNVKPWWRIAMAGVPDAAAA